ncbi:helix-turn-helix domain-containing protein [Amycolatopsis acidicola]|uniref:Helix-turn-helix domain-containing protein n=1 Tax=Amycolatopsis acidicola TaxID=2596893 RepID=A0A5N0V1D0_9PSEU|nr:helix-turn-helix transcriptional regulator [Amycolatopsis acidicola]KAA9160267.1 helix-turn-helix domain-containing protein [Amycolatopsis acidicola]
MDKVELSGFLRDRRARLTPAEAGLELGGRRQTPGLRREEVALLAGISVDYYVRLEQGRGPRPSEQVLLALARALRLTTDEREFLLRLGRAQVFGEQQVPPNVLRLLGRLGDVPAMVIDGRYDLVAWNRMLIALIGDPAKMPPRRRNRLRWLFDPANPAANGELARQCVADVRASGRYPGDPGVRALVDELLAERPAFAALWAKREIEVRRTITKRTVHPVAGELELDCEILAVPGHEHRLLLYTTRTPEALWLLSTVEVH